MLYHNKSTKLKGRHVHSRGVNLAQEADMVIGNVMHSSGFFKGPGTGPNNGPGTVNPNLEVFINKWNSMNSTRKGKFNKYASVNYKQDLAKAAS